MSKIQINDRVKCINVAKQGLQETVVGEVGLIQERDYIVHGQEICENCGDIALDVGILTDKCTTMCICGHIMQTNGIAWKSATRFRKVEEDTKKEEKVSAIKLTETLVLSEN